MDALEARRLASRLEDEEQIVLFRELVNVMTEHSMVEAIRGLIPSDQTSLSLAVSEVDS